MPASPQPSRAAAPGQVSKLYDWFTSYLAGASVLVVLAAGLAGVVILGAIAIAILGILVMSGAMKWIFILALLAIPVGILVHRHQPAPPPPAVRDYWRSTGSPFGDAGWAYEEEIDRFGLVPTSPDDWLRGIWLGRAINVEREHGLGNPLQNKYMRYASENNIVTFSSAGGGKNAAAIIPTLLTNPESMFVNDMKGENWFTTARTRAAWFGHRIVCLNPFNLYGKELGFDKPMTAHFNPLATLRPSQADFVTNINTLAEALIVSDGNDAKHWTARARQLVAGLIGHLCDVADDPAACDHARALLKLPDGAPVNTLPVMGHLLAMNSDTLTGFCKVAAASSRVPFIRDKLASFGQGSKENDGIRSTALGQLDFLSEPALCAFLSKSDFDFADLRREKVTVYCMVPPTLMDVYYRFVRVLVQACFNTMASSPVTERAPVLMLLDEQAKLGGMDIIKTSAATLRGYNVRIWSVFQDLNQLKSLYPDVWETFLANAGVIQVMTVNDAVTANYFSEKIGKRGVKVVSHSSGTNYGTNASGGANSGSSSGTTVTEQAQPFFSPQDFYNQPKWRSLVFVQGLAYPVVVERLEYWRRQDQYSMPNVFQPWGTGSGIPYTPNPEHEPSILGSESVRLATETAEAEGRPFSPLSAPAAGLPMPEAA